MKLKHCLLIFIIFISANVYSQYSNELSKYIYLAEKDNLGSIISINVNTKNLAPMIIIFPEQHIAGASRIETSRYMLRLHDIMNIKDYYLEGYTVEKSQSASYNWDDNPAWKVKSRKAAINNYVNRVAQNKEKGIFNPVEFISLVRVDVNVHPIEKNSEYNNFPLNENESVEIDQYLNNIKDEKVLTQCVEYLNEYNNYLNNYQFTESASSITALKNVLSSNVEIPPRINDLLSKLENFLISADKRSQTMASIISDDIKQKNNIGITLIGAAHLQLMTKIFREKGLNYIVFWPKSLPDKYYKNYLTPGYSLDNREKIILDMNNTLPKQSVIEKSLFNDAFYSSSSGVLTNDLNKFLDFISSYDYSSKRVSYINDNNLEIKWESLILSKIGDLKWVRQSTKYIDKKRYRIDFWNEEFRAGIELKYLRGDNSYRYIKESLTAEKIENYIRAYNLDSISLLILLKKEEYTERKERTVKLQKRIETIIEKILNKDEFKNKKILLNFKIVKNMPNKFININNV